MSLFTELTDAVLEQDPNLSLECFLSARRYIQVRWRALHGTPMPEDALTLFLADPSRGDLTEEQKSLARSSYEAVRRCYRRAAWDLLLYDRMLREGVVHDLREFRSLQRRRYAAGDGGRETRCEALCAPDRASPIPRHLKRDTRACEAAVGAGGPLSALPLSPSGSGPFGAFFPGRNWDKIKGRTPKGYPSAPNTPDPQRGPVVPPTAAVLTVWYQTGCSSFERIGRRQRVAGRFRGGQNWYRKEDRKCWKNE